MAVGSKFIPPNPVGPPPATILGNPPSPPSPPMPSMPPSPAAGAVPSVELVLAGAGCEVAALDEADEADPLTRCTVRPVSLIL